VRQAISALLDDCTFAEANGFYRIHDNAPWKGVANMPDDRLDASYDLLRRTILDRVREPHHD
jgi:hypothetical protein